MAWTQVPTGAVVVGEHKWMKGVWRSRASPCSPFSSDRDMATDTPMWQPAATTSAPCWESTVPPRGWEFLSSSRPLTCRDAGVVLLHVLLILKGAWKSHLLFEIFPLSNAGNSHCASERSDVSLSAVNQGFATLTIDCQFQILFHPSFSEGNTRYTALLSWGDNADHNGTWYRWSDSLAVLI